MVFSLKPILSLSSRGGNRRLLMIVGGLVTVLLITFGISSIHHKEIPKSDAGKAKAVNALPGGLNSDPMQDDLRSADLRDQAHKAQQAGASWSPDLPPGVATKPTPQAPTPTAPQEVGLGEDTTMAKRAVTAHHQPYVTPAPPQQPVPTQMAYIPPQGPPSDAQKGAISRYDRAINDLANQIQGRPLVTEIVYDSADREGMREETTGKGGKTTARPSTESAASLNSKIVANQVLIPAGRGIFAHTVSATNSDLGGGIVLEADTGPLAHDRMIASVSRAGDHLNRLLVKVDKVEHQGQELSVQGVVVAPDTIEAAVASSVDQLYFQRFVLPAAAAFVQGLGQALEMTSNTVGSVGALGNVNYVQSLNFPQQLGVAAGQAASQVNSALMQQTPTGPRINLAANVSVGVIFMTNVTTKP